MKVLIRKLAARLQRLSPIAITTIGLCAVLALSAIDSHTPGPMSFVLFYMLVVVFVGWGAGKRHALFASVVAILIMATVQWGLHRGPPQALWIFLWNNATRLLIFSIAGWLTAEVTRLTRHLTDLVGERTGQWKAEVEGHKTTSSRLAEALEQFEQVINNITEVFWLSDVSKNQMAYISPAYERVWGRKCEELYREPRSWAAAVHPADRDEVLRRAQTDQAAGTYDVEYRILRPDGAVRWIRDRAFPVRNKRGEVYRIAGIADDITERKRTREVLQTQAAILENMAEGVVVMDERGVIVQMNPAGERIWGYERNEMLGQRLSQLSALPEPEATAAMQDVLAALQTAGSWRGTFKNRRKDGAIIICEAVINRVEIQDRVLLVAVQQDVTERVREQEQLQVQARVLESMAEAALLVDETGTIVLTNPALDALAGYQRGELVGQPVHILAGVSLAANNRILQATVEQIKAGEFPTGEYVARRKDGGLIEVETRSSGVSVGGRFHLVVVGQDVTERKRREEALRQSEETLRVFLNALPEPALLMDRNGTLVASNRAFVRTLALPEGELIGQNVFALFPPQVAEARRTVVDQAIRTREPVQFEDTRGARHLMSFISPVLDAAGNVTRVAVFALDITERKRAESALASQQALYQTLFDLSPDGILLEDTSGNILDANQAVCQSFGYSREELLRQNVRCFVPPDGQSEVEAHLAALRAGQALEHEVWNIRKNGERCLMRLNEKPLTLPDGRQGILVVARDITDRKRGETIKQVFLSLGAKLSSARTPVEAARAIYAGADQLWQWDTATLSLYSQESDVMEPVLFCDVMDGQRRETDPPTLAGPPTTRRRQIMREGAELVLRQEDFVPGPEHISFGDVSRHSVSLMYVPMRRDGQPIGVLSIQSYTRDAYTQEDLRTLQALADYCGGAMERIRAEQALQQREALNRSILATAMDGFFALDFATDPGGAIIEVNDAYCRLIGYSREELLQMRIADLEATETPEEVVRHKARILAAGADRFETRHRRKDGQEIHVEISVSSLAGSSERVFGFLRDIAERKRAETTKEAFLSLGTKLNVARTAEEASRAIFAAADLLWEWHCGTLDLWSPEAGEAQTVLNYDIVEGQRREVPGLLKGGEPTARMRRIMRNGPELILREPLGPPEDDSLMIGDISRPSRSLMCVPLRREGQAVGVLSIQSYTPNAFTPEDLRTLQALADHCGGALERIHAEQALRESEELLRAFYDSPGVFRGIAELLEDDILVLSANAPQSKAYGRSPEDMHGVLASELGVARPVIDLWLAKFRESQATDQPVTFEYSSDFRSPGSWGLATVGPLRLAQGDRPRLAFVALDITERKRAEEMLREAHDKLELRVQKRTAELQAANAALREVYGELERRVQERTAELQAANAALGESEERYRSLVDNLNVGVYRNTPGPEGRFLHANPALARMHGYDSVEEFQKVSVADLYQQPGERKAFVAELLRQGSVVNHELRLKKKDGTPIYASVNATVHRDPSGAVDWIDGVLEDITERKKAEQSLTEALDLNRTLVSASTVGIAVYKASGQCVVANPALARLTGGTVEQLLQQDFRRLKSWRNYGLLAKAEAALQTRQPQELETESRTTFGRELAIDARFSSFTSQGERHLLVMIADETDARRAQKALRASEERYRALAESSPDAIFIVGRDIKVQYVNSAMAGLWKRAPEELIGLAQAELFPPETAQYHCKVVAEVFATGQPVRRDEALAFPISEQWVEIRLAPLFGEQGTVSSVMGVCRDITERKRAERQLAEALDLNQKMIAASVLGIAAYRASGECVLANEAVARSVGGSVSEVQQGNFRRLKSWQESGLLQLAEEALSQGQARSGEFHCATRFGKTVWLDCHAAPFVSRGQPHLLIMALDISERKAADSLLQAQRDLGVSFSLTSDLNVALKRLLEITMQMGGVDSAGIYLLNHATGGMELAAHHGLSSRFVKAVSHWTPDSPQIRLLGQGRPVFAPYRTLPFAHDDARLSERLRAIALVPLCHDGKVIGALTLASHLTDEIPHQTQLVIEGIATQAAGAIARIRTEEALRESETRLRAIISSAPVLLFAADRDGIIRFEDGQGLKALGTTPGANVGRSVMEVYAHFPAVLQNARRALQGEAFESVVEVGPVTFDCWYSPTRDQAGKPAGYIGVATNITERHRLERQVLEISDREQARIGQDIHDGLCQQLVSLAFDANSLQRALSAKNRPEAKTAGRIAEFLDQAITESRQLSRGLFPVRLGTVGLSPALQQLAYSTSARFKIRCSFADRGPTKVKDAAVATHLYRIAQEAVANAVKHSRAGQVSIRLKAGTSQIELRVEDDGAGLPPAKRKKATGLGLHIMDYRARAIGGTLHIAPRRRGGTTVSCCVPRPRS